MTTLTLKIGKMHCEACSSGIKMYTESKDGVAKADVSYKDGKGTFEFDESKVKEEEIVSAIQELGYTAEK